MPEVTGLLEEDLQNHNNSFRLQNGEYTFYVPTTGERLSPNNPPESFQRDSELGTGYQFLREFGDRLHVTCRYGSHAVDRPEDFGDHTYEDSLERADMLLIEGLGWTQSVVTGLNQISERGSYDASNNDMTDYLQTPLHRRQAAALSGTTTVVACVDVENTEDALRQSLISQGGLIHKIRSATAAHPSDLIRAEILNTIPYEMQREWFMIGQIGYRVAEAAQHDEDILEKLRNSSLKVVMTMGGTHRNLSHKLAQFHVPHTDVVITDLPPQNTLIMRAVENGTLPQGQLEHAISE